MTTEEKLIALYEQAEIRLREIITQKVQKGNSTVYQRSLLKQIIDELKRLKRSSAAEVGKLVKENYTDALEELVKELKASGVQVEEISPEPIKPAELAMSGLNKTQIRIIAENTNYDFNRAIDLVGRRIEDGIREAAIEATGEKLTTGQTVRQMQKNLEEKLRAQNLTAVEYSNGAKMPLKQYAEMVSRSTTAETQNTAKIVQGQEWGYDLVEMTSHSPTCAICSMYQGRVYAVSKEAANGKYKLKDGTALNFPYLYETAFAGGYKTIHPNCRHRINEYVFSAYTQDELRKQDKANNAPFDDLRSDQERKAYSEMIAEKRRALENRRQYEKIKAALPNDAPKSFAGFMRMKRSNSENYQNLIKDYRYISRVAKQQNDGIINVSDNNSPFFDVTDKAIDKVPEINIFKDKSLNKAHQNASKDLLREVMSHKELEKGTEFSIVYDSKMRRIPEHNYVQGGVGYVSIEDPGQPFHAFHNHGSGGTLSFSDISGFASRNNMLSLTAQGNNGNKFTLISNANSDKLGYMYYLQKVSSEPIFVFENYSFSLNDLYDKKNISKISKVINELPSEQRQKLKECVVKKTTEHLMEAEKYGIEYKETIVAD